MIEPFIEKMSVFTFNGDVRELDEIMMRAAAWLADNAHRLTIRNVEINRVPCDEYDIVIYAWENS